MYSEKFYETIKEHGYKMKERVVRDARYTDLVKPECEKIFVGRYLNSINETYFRTEDEILNDILHPVDYEAEFEKMMGWEEE